MYYEEQVINGVLCSRNHTDSEWVPMTAAMLTARLLEARKQQNTQGYGPLPGQQTGPMPGMFGWEVKC